MKTAIKVRFKKKKKKKKKKTLFRWGNVNFRKQNVPMQLFVCVGQTDVVDQITVEPLITDTLINEHLQ
jgi:hypothetical protein